MNPAKIMKIDHKDGSGHRSKPAELVAPTTVKFGPHHLAEIRSVTDFGIIFESGGVKNS
jgi:hypothetical protein